MNTLHRGHKISVIEEMSARIIVVVGPYVNARISTKNHPALSLDNIKALINTSTTHLDALQIDNLNRAAQGQLIGE